MTQAPQATAIVNWGSLPVETNLQQSRNEVNEFVDTVGGIARDPLKLATTASVQASSSIAPKVVTLVAGSSMSPAAGISIGGVTGIISTAAQPASLELSHKIVEKSTEYASASMKSGANSSIDLFK